MSQVHQSQYNTLLLLHEVHYVTHYLSPTLTVTVSKHLSLQCTHAYAVSRQRAVKSTSTDANRCQRPLLKTVVHSLPVRSP
jgi:hypothetical protein